MRVMTIDGGFRGLGATFDELTDAIERLGAEFDRVRAAAEAGRLPVVAVQELQSRYDQIRGTWAAEARGEETLSPDKRAALVEAAEGLIRTIRAQLGGHGRTALKVALFSLGAFALFGGGMFLIIAASERR